MYRALDEEIFLAPETIIWNALRVASDCDEDEPLELFEARAAIDHDDGAD